MFKPQNDESYHLNHHNDAQVNSWAKFSNQSLTFPDSDTQDFSCNYYISDTYFPVNGAPDTCLPTDAGMEEMKDGFLNSNDKQEFTQKADPSLRTWNNEDDDCLAKIGVIYKNDWKKIAIRVKAIRGIKKTPNFLMKRFKEITFNENLDRKHFKHDEDVKLAGLMEIYGTSWIDIAKHFPTRAPITMKNRYYSHIKKNGLLEKLQEEARRLMPRQEEGQEEKKNLESYKEDRATEEEKILDFIDYSNEENYFDKKYEAPIFSEELSEFIFQDMN